MAPPGMSADKFNRIRAMKGTRRPANRPPMPSAPASPSLQNTPQATPTPFGNGNFNTVNGTQEVKSPFQFASQSSANATQQGVNGAQSPPQSASFPPLGGSSNTNPGFQFAAPNSSFNFSTSSATPFNNPFATISRDNTGASQPSGSAQGTGFQGSIFNLPAQAPVAPDAKSSGKPFTFGQSTTKLQQQSQQTASNPFALSATAQSSTLPTPDNANKNDSQPQASSSNIFGNIPTAPFGQAGSSSKQPASGIFGQSGQSRENQITSNLFGSSQPQQGQSPSSLFGASAVNSGQARSPESPKQPEDRMSMTPDTSPQAATEQKPSNPFAFINVPASPTPQRGPSNPFSSSTIATAAGEKPAVDTQPNLGRSLFDRVSQPMNPTASPSKNDSNPSITAEGPKGALEGFGQSAQTTSSVDSASPAKQSQHAVKPLFSPLSSSQTFGSSTPGNVSSGFKDTPGPSFPGATASQSTSKALMPPPSSHAASSVTFPSDIALTSSDTSVSNADWLSSFKAALGDPPSSLSAVDEGQELSLNTRWRLKGLSTGIVRLCQQNTSDGPSIIAYYEARKQAIINAAGRPLSEIAGSKRKLSQDEHESSSPKKARPTASAFDSATPKAPTSVALTNGASSNQSLIDQQSPFKQSSPTKRKADEDIPRDDDQEGMNGAKKARPDGSVSYPSLSSSTVSETSNIFKSIVNDEKREPSSAALKQINGVFGDSPAKSGSGAVPGSSNAFPSSNGTVQTSQEATTAPKAQSPNLFAAVASASPSVSKPNSISSTSSASNVASPFKPVNTTASPYSKPVAKPPVEKPAIQPPKFDSAATADFMSQFAKASEASEKKDREKRKAAEYDSDEENEAEWERKYAEEQRAKKQKLEDSIKGKAAKYVPGKGFVLTDEEPAKETNNDIESNGPSSGQSSRAPSLSVFDQSSKPTSNGLNPFAHLSDVESGAEGSKIGDADDEDSGGSEAEEHHDNATASGLGTQSAFQKSQDSAPSNLLNVSGTPKPKANPKPAGPSLFDRISKDENGQAIRELPPAEEKKTSSLFSASASQTGSNIFSKPSSSTPGDNTFSKPFTGFDFGASTSTPKTNLFGQSSAPKSVVLDDDEASPGDHTWKADSPIKFGATSAAPSVQVTSPTPSKNPLGGLFGSSQTSGTTNTSAGPSSGLFGSSTAKDPSVGFGISFGDASKSASGSLFLPSEAPAEESSRATSPGASSVAESSGGPETEGASDAPQKEPEQLDLTRGPGEEDEETLFEVKGKAITYSNEAKDWVNKGVGRLRILKHSETGKTRILMRQEPSGKIILNAALLNGIEYKYVAPKSVRMPIAADTGALASYIIRVGKEADAKRLAEILEEHKGD